jgi:hypothetical protein
MRQWTYNVTLRRVRVTIVAVEKQKIVKVMLVCTLALVTRHAKRMRRIILSSVACLAVPYFSTLSHKRHDFRKKIIEHKMCVSIVSTACFCNISHYKIIQRDSVINVHRSSCKVPVILVRFLWNLNFLYRFSKKSSNIKFHENMSSGSLVVPCGRTDGRTDRQTDRQTDMKKLIVAFRNFANAPKN